MQSLFTRFLPIVALAMLSGCMTLNSTPVKDTGYESRRESPTEIKSAPIKMVKGFSVTFNTLMHDFGTVKVGEKASYTYTMTNTGSVPVTIELVSGCDCTNLTWPEGKTFQPGEAGQIKATFLSEKEEERGQLTKTIDILFLNEDPETGYQIIKELKYKVTVQD